MGGTDYTMAGWIKYDYSSLSSKYVPLMYFDTHDDKHHIWMRCENGLTFDIVVYYT